MIEPDLEPAEAFLKVFRSIKDSLRVFHSIKETESEIEQDLLNQVNETLESEDPAHTKENYYRGIIELSQYYIIKKFTQYIPIHTNMTIEQFKKAQELHEHIENLKEIQEYLTYPGEEYKLAIQSDRNCFTINEPDIEDKVRDYIKQRINELEEEFEAL